MVINNSPNVSNFDFEVVLDIAQQVPKAIVTDISTYIGTGYDNIVGIVIRMVDPSNLQFTTTVYPPDVDIVPGLGTFSKNLPFFNGQVKWSGNPYKIYATLIDADGTEYIWTDEDTGLTYKAINLCKPNSLSNAKGNWGGLKLSVVDNCDLGMLEVSDGGTGFSYNGESPSVTEASLVITYPIDSTGTTAQATATFIPFTFPLTVAGVYSIVGTVTQTYQFTDTTSVKAAYYFQKTFDISCGYTLCKALCDYEKLEADIESCSIKNPNEALQQLKTFIRVIGYLGKIAWFKQCGKNFGDVLEKLRTIAGFNCNCDCNPQGIAPAPLYNSGTLVKGDTCGDVDFSLTKFMGNIKIDMSDVTYLVVAASDIEDFVTITPSEGTCSKTYTIGINVCEMLATVGLNCLNDVNVGSPSPSDGAVLTWVSSADEWQALIEEPDWTALTYGTAMANTGGANQVGEYRKFVNGIVEVRGGVTASNYPTSSTITTLPSGFRPPARIEFAVNVNNLGSYFSGVLSIDSAGVVVLLVNTSGWTGVSGTFHLSTIRFSTV